MTRSPETRHSLLVRLRDAGDQQAWGEFIEIYEPLIYRFARSRGLQDADAREIVQEVCIAVAGAIGRFKPSDRPGGFRAWLMQVTRNHTLNLLRKSAPLVGGGSSAATRLAQLACQEAEPAAVLEKAFDEAHRRQVFCWAAGKLRGRFDETNWQAFWRTCVEGQSIDRVARDMGIAISQVHVARCRIISRLRAIVEQHSQTDSKP